MKKISMIIMFIVLTVALISVQAILPCAAAETPKKGGVFKMSYNREAGQFGYPNNIRHSDSLYAWFGGLQAMIWLSTEKMGQWEPCLAESWDLAADKSSYTFHIRKGVKFSDGTDLNAQAIKWNLDKVIESDRPYLRKVTSTEILDDYTIKYNIKDWDVLVLDDFGTGATIISPTACEKNGGEEWANTNPVGTGPFKMSSFRRGQVVKYVKNENYWQEGLPYLDGIEIVTIPDPMTAIASLKKGEIQGIRDADVVTARELKGKGFEFGTVSGGAMAFYFNSIDPTSIWADKRMRMALEYAINKEEITEKLGYGYIQPLYEIINNITAAGNPATTPRKYDPEKAKKLMAEAGYAKGIKIKNTYFEGFKSDLMLAAQANLSEVGIELEMNPLTHTAAVQSSQNPAPPGELRFTRGRGGAPILKQTKDELSSASLYFVGVQRPKAFDDAVFSAAKIPDPMEQLKLLEKAERVAYDDEAMIIPLWTDPSINIHIPELKGVVWYVGKPDPHFEKAWIDK